MTKALLINGSESSIIQIDGIDGIVGYFAGKGDFIGKTLPSDGEVSVRRWLAVKKESQGIEIFSAYNKSTRKFVDLSEEFARMEVAKI